MADISAPTMLIFSAKPGDSSTAIEFSGTDWRARVMAGMTSLAVLAVWAAPAAQTTHFALVGTGASVTG